MVGLGYGTGAPIVQLYHEKSIILPDVSRVLACLYEKDIEFKTHTASYKSLLRLQASSHAPVPFYDGPTFLEESRGICRYIAEKYEPQGYPFLLGKDALERASVEQWLHNEEHAFNPPSRALYCHLAFPLDEEDEDDIDMHTRKLEEVLEVYEQRLSDSRFLAGNKFTLADLVHLPNSHYITASDKFVYLYDSRKNVSRWWEEISTRKSWQQVLRDMKRVEEQNKQQELEKQQRQKEHPRTSGHPIRIYSRKQTGTEPRTVLVPPADTVSPSIVSPLPTDTFPNEALVSSSQSTPTADKTSAALSKETTVFNAPDETLPTSVQSTPTTSMKHSILAQSIKDDASHTTAKKPPVADAVKSSTKDASIPEPTVKDLHTRQPSSSKVVSNNLDVFDYYPSHTDEETPYIEPTPRRASETLDAFSGSSVGTGHTKTSSISAKEKPDQPSVSDFYKSDSETTGIDSQYKESIPYSGRTPPTFEPADTSPSKPNTTDVHRRLQAEQWHTARPGLNDLKQDTDHLMYTQQGKPSKDVKQYPSQDSKQATSHPVPEDPMSIELVQRRENTTPRPYGQRSRGIVEDKASPDQRSASLLPSIQEHDATPSRQAAAKDARGRIPSQPGYPGGQDTYKQPRGPASVPGPRAPQDARDTFDESKAADSTVSSESFPDASQSSLPRQDLDGAHHTTAPFQKRYSGTEDTSKQAKDKISTPWQMVDKDAEDTPKDKKISYSSSSQLQPSHFQRADAPSWKQKTTEDRHSATSAIQEKHANVKDTTGISRNVAFKPDQTIGQDDQDTFKETKSGGPSLLRDERSDTWQAAPTLPEQELNQDDRSVAPPSQRRYRSSTPPSKTRYQIAKDASKQPRGTAPTPKKKAAQHDNGTSEESNTADEVASTEQPLNAWRAPISPQIQDAKNSSRTNTSLPKRHPDDDEDQQVADTASASWQTAPDGDTDIFDKTKLVDPTTSAKPLYTQEGALPLPRQAEVEDAQDKGRQSRVTVPEPQKMVARDAQDTHGERKTAKPGEKSSDRLQAIPQSRPAAAKDFQGAPGQTIQFPDILHTTKKSRGTFEETKDPDSTLPRAQLLGAQDTRYTIGESRTPTADQRKDVSRRLQPDAQDPFQQSKLSSIDQKGLGSLSSQERDANDAQATTSEEKSISTERRKEMIPQGSIKVEKTSSIYQKQPPVAQDIQEKAQIIGADDKAYGSTPKHQQAPDVLYTSDEKLNTTPPAAKNRFNFGAEEPYIKDTIDDQKLVPPLLSKEPTSQVQPTSESLQEAASRGRSSTKSSIIEQWQRASVPMDVVTSSSGDDKIGMATIDQKLTPMSQQATPSVKGVNQMTKESDEQRVEQHVPTEAETSGFQSASPPSPGTSTAHRAATDDRFAKQSIIDERVGEPTKMQASTPDFAPAHSKRATPGGNEIGDPELFSTPDGQISEAAKTRHDRAILQEDVREANWPTHNVAKDTFKETEVADSTPSSAKPLYTQRPLHTPRHTELEDARDEGIKHRETVPDRQKMVERRAGTGGKQLPDRLKAIPPSRLATTEDAPGAAGDSIQSPDILDTSKKSRGSYEEAEGPDLTLSEAKSLGAQDAQRTTGESTTPTSGQRKGVSVKPQPDVQDGPKESKLSVADWNDLGSLSSEGKDAIETETTITGEKPFSTEWHRETSKKSESTTPKARPTDSQGSVKEKTSSIYQKKPLVAQDSQERAQTIPFGEKADGSIPKHQQASDAPNTFDEKLNASEPERAKTHRDFSAEEPYKDVSTDDQKVAQPLLSREPTSQVQSPTEQSHDAAPHHIDQWKRASATEQSHDAAPHHIDQWKRASAPLHGQKPTLMEQQESGKKTVEPPVPIETEKSGVQRASSPFPGASVDDHATIGDKITKQSIIDERVGKPIQMQTSSPDAHPASEPTKRAAREGHEIGDLELVSTPDGQISEATKTRDDPATVHEDVYDVNLSTHDVGKDTFKETKVAESTPSSAKPMYIHQPAITPSRQTHVGEARDKSMQSRETIPEQQKKVDRKSGISGEQSSDRQKAIRPSRQVATAEDAPTGDTIQSPYIPDSSIESRGTFEEAIGPGSTLPKAQALDAQDSQLTRRESTMPTADQRKDWKDANNGEEKSFSTERLREMFQESESSTPKTQPTNSQGYSLLDKMSPVYQKGPLPAQESQGEAQIIQAGEKVDSSTPEHQESSGAPYTYDEKLSASAPDRADIRDDHSAEEPYKKYTADDQKVASSLSSKEPASQVQPLSEPLQRAVPDGDLPSKSHTTIDQWQRTSAPLHAVNTDSGDAEVVMSSNNDQKSRLTSQEATPSSSVPTGAELSDVGRTTPSFPEAARADDAAVNDKFAKQSNIDERVGSPKQRQQPIKASHPASASTKRTTPDVDELVRTPERHRLEAGKATQDPAKIHEDVHDASLSTHDAAIDEKTATYHASGDEPITGYAHDRQARPPASTQAQPTVETPHDPDSSQYVHTGDSRKIGSGKPIVTDQEATAPIPGSTSMDPQRAGTLPAEVAHSGQRSTLSDKGSARAAQPFSPIEPIKAPSNVSAANYTNAPQTIFRQQARPSEASTIGIPASGTQGVIRKIQEVTPDDRPTDDDDSDAPQGTEPCVEIPSGQKFTPPCQDSALSVQPPFSTEPTEDNTVVTPPDQTKDIETITYQQAITPAPETAKTTFAGANQEVMAPIAGPTSMDPQLAGTLPAEVAHSEQKPTPSDKGSPRAAQTFSPVEPIKADSNVSAYDYTNAPQMIFRQQARPSEASTIGIPASGTQGVIRKIQEVTPDDRPTDDSNAPQGQDSAQSVQPPFSTEPTEDNKFVTPRDQTKDSETMTHQKAITPASETAKTTFHGANQEAMAPIAGPTSMDPQLAGTLPDEVAHSEQKPTPSGSPHAAQPFSPVEPIKADSNVSADDYTNAPQMIFRQQARPSEASTIGIPASGTQGVIRKIQEVTPDDRPTDDSDAPQGQDSAQSVQPAFSTEPITPPDQTKDIETMTHQQAITPAPETAKTTFRGANQEAMAPIAGPTSMDPQLAGTLPAEVAHSEQKPTPSDKGSSRAAQPFSPVEPIEADNNVSAADYTNAPQMVFWQQARPSEPSTIGIPASDTKGVVREIQEVTPDDRPTDDSGKPFVPSEEQVSYASQAIPGQEEMTSLPGATVSPTSDAQIALSEDQEFSRDDQQAVESTTPLFSSGKQGSHVQSAFRPGEVGAGEKKIAPSDQELSHSAEQPTSSKPSKEQMVVPTAEQIKEQPTIIDQQNTPYTREPRTSEDALDTTPSHGNVHPAGSTEPDRRPLSVQGEEPKFSTQAPPPHVAKDSLDPEDITTDQVMAPIMSPSVPSVVPLGTLPGTNSVQPPRQASMPSTVALESVPETQHGIPEGEATPAEQKFAISDKGPAPTSEPPSSAELWKEEANAAAVDQPNVPRGPETTGRHQVKSPSPDAREALQRDQQPSHAVVPEQTTYAVLPSDLYDRPTPEVESSVVDKETTVLSRQAQTSAAEPDLTPISGDVLPTSSLQNQDAQPSVTTQAPTTQSLQGSAPTQDDSFRKFEPPRQASTDQVMESVTSSAAPSDTPQGTEPGQDSAQFVQPPFSTEPTEDNTVVIPPDQTKNMETITRQQAITPAPETAKITFPGANQEAVAPIAGPTSMDPQLAGTLPAEVAHSEQNPTPSDKRSARAAQPVSPVEPKKADSIVSSADHSNAPQMVFRQQARSSAPSTIGIPASDTQGVTGKIQEVTPDNRRTSDSGKPFVPSKEQVSHASQAIPGQEEMASLPGATVSPTSDAQVASSEVQEVGPDDQRAAFGPGEVGASEKKFAPPDQELPHSAEQPTSGESMKEQMGIPTAEQIKEQSTMIDQQNTPYTREPRTSEDVLDATPSHGDVHPTGSIEPDRRLLSVQGEGPKSATEAHPPRVAKDSLDTEAISNNASVQSLKPLTTLDASGATHGELVVAEQKSSPSGQDSAYPTKPPSSAELRSKEVGDLAPSAHQNSTTEPRNGDAIVSAPDQAKDSQTIPGQQVRLPAPSSYTQHPSGKRQEDEPADKLDEAKSSKPPSVSTLDTQHVAAPDQVAVDAEKVSLSGHYPAPAPGTQYGTELHNADVDGQKLSPSVQDSVHSVQPSLSTAPTKEDSVAAATDQTSTLEKMIGQNDTTPAPDKAETQFLGTPDASRVTQRSNDDHINEKHAGQGQVSPSRHVSEPPEGHSDDVDKGTTPGSSPVETSNTGADSTEIGGDARLSSGDVPASTSFPETQNLQGSAYAKNVPADSLGKFKSSGHLSTDEALEPRMSPSAPSVAPLGTVSDKEPAHTSEPPSSAEPRKEEANVAAGDQPNVRRGPETTGRHQIKAPSPDSREILQKDQQASRDDDRTSNLVDPLVVTEEKASYAGRASEEPSSEVSSAVDKMMTLPSNQAQTSSTGPESTPISGDTRLSSDAPVATQVPTPRAPLESASIQNVLSDAPHGTKPDQVSRASEPPYSAEPSNEASYAGRTSESREGSPVVDAKTTLPSRQVQTANTGSDSTPISGDVPDSSSLQNQEARPAAATQAPTVQAEGSASTKNELADSLGDIKSLRQLLTDEVVAPITSFAAPSDSSQGTEPGTNSVQPSEEASFDFSSDEKPTMSQGDQAKTLPNGDLPTSQVVGQSESADSKGMDSLKNLKGASTDENPKILQQIEQFDARSYKGNSKEADSTVRSSTFEEPQKQSSWPKGSIGSGDEPGNQQQTDQAIVQSLEGNDNQAEQTKAHGTETGGLEDMKASENTNQMKPQVETSDHPGKETSGVQRLGESTRDAPNSTEDAPRNVQTISKSKESSRSSEESNVQQQSEDKTGDTEAPGSETGQPREGDRLANSYQNKNSQSPTGASDKSAEQSYPGTQNKDRDSSRLGDSADPSKPGDMDD